jgi:methionyl aminopeptidase
VIRLKNERQLQGMRLSCKLLSALFRELIPLVRIGARTKDLDRFTHDFIVKSGARPAFLGYQGYPASLCVSVNEEVIHGIPGERVIRDGDLVGIDCGIDLAGFFSDAAVTVSVGKVSDEARALVAVTRECLGLGLAQARAGNRIQHISRAVFERAQAAGYGVVHQYCGHGVGFSPHEDPSVPNYIGPGPNPRLIPGMVLAIEPMVNLGRAEVDVLSDDWTVVTRDRKLSAHFEHTVAVLDGRTEVLTEWTL